MTIEQLIEIVNDELTISGKLPKILPDNEIKRIIKEDALGFFYDAYKFSTQISYYVAINTTENCGKYCKNYKIATNITNIVNIRKIYNNKFDRFISKYTNLKSDKLYNYHFNHINSELVIFSDFNDDLLIKCYIKIDEEDLFNDYIFKKYVIGLSKIKLSELISCSTLYTSFQFDHSSLKTQGEKEIEEVKHYSIGYNNIYYSI